MWWTEAKLHRWGLHEWAFFSSVSRSGNDGWQRIDANVPILSLPPSSVTDNGPSGPYVLSNSCWPNDCCSGPYLKAHFSSSYCRYLLSITQQYFLVKFYLTKNKWAHHTRGQRRIYSTSNLLQSGIHLCKDSPFPQVNKVNKQ